MRLAPRRRYHACSLRSAPVVCGGGAGGARERRRDRTHIRTPVRTHVHHARPCVRRPRPLPAGCGRARSRRGGAGRRLRIARRLRRARLRRLVPGLRSLRAGLRRGLGLGRARRDDPRGRVGGALVPAAGDPRGGRADRLSIDRARPGRSDRPPRPRRSRRGRPRQLAARRRALDRAAGDPLRGEPAAPVRPRDRRDPRGRVVVARDVPGPVAPALAHPLPAVCPRPPPVPVTTMPHARAISTHLGLDAP